jgi:uncharacterized Ntn-hydrolase superfamily protein
MVSIRRIPLLSGLTLVLAATAAADAEANYDHYIPAEGTYSIIAVDQETGQLGMGVQSKALSVGNRTITGVGGTAIVAHQSSSNPMYGAVVIDGIQRGMSPEQALDFALRADDMPERRQVAVIDIEGRSAVWTSPEITQWAGHRCEPSYCVQGNTITGPEVLDAMAAAFEETEGELADKLLAALDAGQEAGGDWRGMQGASIVVKLPLVRAGFDDTLIDIRVDDHPEPLVELRRVYDVSRAMRMMGSDVNPAMAAEDYDAAWEAAMEAHELAPSYDLPVVAMVEIEMRRGNMEAALERLEQAIAINPWVIEQVSRAPRFAPLAETEAFQELASLE